MTTVTAESTEAGGTRDRPVRILRALAQSAGPLSTPGLVDLLDEGISTRQRALTRYGNVLRDHESAGHVRRSGRTAGRRGLAETWIITGAGRTWLADCEATRARRSAERAEAEWQAAEDERAAAARNAKLQQARELHDRATPRAARAQSARELRDAGCTLEEIGAVFGVSREMIRLDLLWDADAASQMHGNLRRSMRRDPAACALSLAVADAVYRLRADRGWSIARLAEESGLSAFTVGHCEGGGSNYSLPVLEKIAAALGSNPLDLLAVPPEARRASSVGQVGEA